MHKIIFYVDRQGKSSILDYLAALEASNSKDSRIKRTKIREYVKALEEAGPDRALLALCEVFAAQRTLDDGLVGRPVEQVVDEHTGQQ